jgi:hypothetical protein
VQAQCGALAGLTRAAATSPPHRQPHILPAPSFCRPAPSFCTFPDRLRSKDWKRFGPTPRRTLPDTRRRKMLPKKVLGLIQAPFCSDPVPLWGARNNGARQETDEDMRRSLGGISFYRRRWCRCVGDEKIDTNALAQGRGGTGPGGAPVSAIAFSLRPLASHPQPTPGADRNRITLFLSWCEQNRTAVPAKPDILLLAKPDVPAKVDFCLGPLVGVWRCDRITLLQRRIGLCGDAT